MKHLYQRAKSKCSHLCYSRIEDLWLQAVLKVHNRFAHAELCYEVVNLVWACLVVAPMVVLYWKGTWDLLANTVQHKAFFLHCCSGAKQWVSLTPHPLGLLGGKGHVHRTVYSTLYCVGGGEVADLFLFPICLPVVAYQRQYFLTTTRQYSNNQRQRCKRHFLCSRCVVARAQF